MTTTLSPARRTDALGRRAHPPAALLDADRASSCAR